MTARPFTAYLPPALLVLSTALAAANWYLRPEHAGAWATAVIVLTAMTFVFFFVPGRSLISWLVLPLAAAEWLSFILLPSAALLIAAQWLRFRRDG